MKYNLSSEQLKKLLPKSLKKVVFKFWDQQQKIDNIKSTMSFFGIPYQLSTEVFKWALEWYGEDKLNKKLDEIINKIMRGVDGSYDFNFCVKDAYIEPSEEEIFFDVIAEGSGKVQVVWNNEILYDNIYDASKSDEMGWEVRDEIKEVIYIELRKILDLPFNFSIGYLTITSKEEKLENRL